MKFNYQIELKKFKAEHEQLRIVMRENGMGEEAIRELFIFDWKQFKKDRNYCLHNQPLPETEGSNSDSFNPLADKFIESFSESDHYFGDFFDVAQVTDNEGLAKGLNQLSEEQLELLWMIIDLGLSQNEVAKILGISKSAVTQRMNTIRKKIKLFCEQP